MNDYEQKATAELFKVKGGYVLRSTHDELYGHKTSVHTNIQEALDELSRVFRLINE